MSEKVCSDEEWGGAGWDWALTRGGEESWVEVQCLSVDSGGALIEIKPSWKASYRETVTEGHTIGIEGDQDHHWWVMCTDINISQGLVKVKICYEEDIVATCADHTNESDCIANHCHWYNGACHGEPLPDECSDYDTQSTCEAAGCTWENGACVSSGVEPIPDDSTRMEINRDVSILGVGFKLREIDCARGEAIVEFVGSGVRKVLILGGLGVMFPIPFGVIYVAAIWVNNECTEIAARALKSPKDPEQKGPETDSGKTIAEMDEDKFALLEVSLDPDDLTDITMDELKSRDIDAHAITQGDTTKPDWATKEQWDELVKYYEELLEDLAAGRISIEELWALWDEKVIEVVAESFISEHFTLLATGLVMADSPVVVSGRTPKKNMRIQIMVVKKWFGYDWAATDKVLKEVTSNEFFQYETELTFDEFGAVAIYARAPKEWYEIWKEDHDTDKASIWVITWTVVIALALAVGLVLEKKYNKLGIFKKR